MLKGVVNVSKLKFNAFSFCGLFKINHIFETQFNCLFLQNSQIEKKIIELDFDGDKIDKWAASLAPKVSKGFKGDNEWSTTTTKEEKNAERAKRLVFEQIRKERAKKRVEYLKQKKIRDAEYAAKKAERDEKRAIRDAEKKERLEKKAALKA